MSIIRLTRNRIRGGTLVLISAMMLASAALRLGAATAPAIAGLDDASGPAERGAAPGVHEQRTNHDAPEPTDAELGDLIQVLKRRSVELDAREMQIEDRMQALAIADAALDRKTLALIDAEEKLRATLAIANGAAENDLSRLTEVYENMKPKDSATLFQEMDPAFAAGFLGRMRPDAAAAILAGMDPPSAYAVSVILAGRNAAVPTE